MSAKGILFFVTFHSSWLPRSAEDGAVEALLWRLELSVDVVFVVLDDPLPLSQPVSTKSRRDEGRIWPVWQSMGSDEVFSAIPAKVLG